MWALHEYGIRAVLAPSFSPIFHGNCIRNGIVPVTLAAADIAAIAAYVTEAPQDHCVTVDLQNCEVTAGAQLRYSFSLEGEAREMLLEVSLTMTVLVPS